MLKLQIQVRVAVPEDGAAVAFVHDSSRRAAYADLLSAQQLDAMTLDERSEFWRRRILQNDVRVFVAEDEDGTMCGFIAVETNRGSNKGEIDRIYVLPSHAKKGVGAALMKHAIDHLRDYGFEKAVLWTFEGNRNARDFYKHYGFKRDGGQRKWPGMPKELRYSISIEPW